MQSQKPFPRINLKRWLDELGITPGMALNADHLDLDAIGQALDRTLAREGSVVVEHAAGLGRRKDFALIERREASEEHFQFTRTRDLIDSDEELTGFLFRVGTDCDLMGYAVRERDILAPSSLSPFWGPAPPTLLEAQVRRLFARQFYGHQEWRRIKRRRPSLPIPKHWANQWPIGHLEKWRLFDGKLELTAFLVTRHLNRPDVVERYAPALRYEDFHRYQAQVLAAAHRRMPQLHQKFGAAWMRLTQAQQDALRLVYMHRDPGETQEDIAKQLNISLGSLKKRVAGAAQKLSKVLDRPLVSKRRILLPEPESSPPIYRIDVACDGFEVELPCEPVPLPEPARKAIEQKLSAKSEFARVTCARYSHDETSLALPHPWAGRGNALPAPYESWQHDHAVRLARVRREIDGLKPRVFSPEDYKCQPPQVMPQALRENRQSHPGRRLLALPATKTTLECDAGLRPPPPSPPRYVLEDE
jgi:DNA-directed RNA polymerase specialized sigma24 family protein